MTEIRTAPSGAAPLAAPSSRRWLTLVVVGLAQLMVVLDNTVVNIALPSAQHDLGFSNGERQWIVTAYSLAFGSLLLLGGRLSDLIGRKRTFVLGLIGFAAASAFGGAATSFGMLVAARATQGAFGALLAPTALAVLTTTFIVPKERARAFGVFGAIAGAGGAIGLLLGGVLTQDLDWRWSLYINVVIAIAAVIGAITLLPAMRHEGPRPRLDVLGTVLISAALFGVVFGFSNAETDSWGSGWTWGPIIVAAVLLVAFFAWQRRTAHPLLPLGVLLDRNRGAAFASVLIAGAGMFAIFLFVTYYTQSTLGYTPIQTGLAFLPMIGGLVLAAQIGTNVLLPRFGPKVLVPIGMLLVASAMVLFTRLDVHSSYAGALLPALIVMGLGMGTVMPGSMQSATLGVDRSSAGVASALVNTSQQVGGSIGTALLNTLAATTAATFAANHLAEGKAVVADAAVHGYAIAYWLDAALFVFGALLAAIMFRRRTPAPRTDAVASPQVSAEPVLAH